MVREILEIDEDLCVGCGNCVPNCHQGALQIIDGKARLISDLMCEGIGVCVGHCPTGAMTITKREAEPYDEYRVMDKIAAGGPNVISAHLQHLRTHAQHEYLDQALTYLSERAIEIPDWNAAGNMAKRHSVLPDFAVPQTISGGGCPGAAARSLPPSPRHTAGDIPGHSQPSQLRQWPVQLHLLNPAAGYLAGADLLLAADCTAFAAGGFHSDFLRGKALAIACPKLDDSQDVYTAKLVRMIDEAKINTLTVMMMEVPCCGGLLQTAHIAVQRAERKIPVKQIVLSLEGEVLLEEWI